MKTLNRYLRHSLKFSQSENIIERLKLTKDSKLITECDKVLLFPFENDFSIFKDYRYKYLKSEDDCKEIKVKGDHYCGYLYILKLDDVQKIFKNKTLIKGTKIYLLPNDIEVNAIKEKLNSIKWYHFHELTSQINFTEITNQFSK